MMANNTKLVSATLGIVLVVGLTACSTADQQKAKEQAREAGHELSADAKKAGHEIKKDAKELGNKVDSAASSDKVSHVDSDAKNAAARTDDKLDHAALEAKVKTKLISDAGFSTLTSVSVSVTGDVVTLTGTAASEEQKRSAGVAAAQVNGVARVRNLLSVRP
jgi:osmotically-inducible protein OsmY